MSILKQMLSKAFKLTRQGPMDPEILQVLWHYQFIAIVHNDIRASSKEPHQESEDRIIERWH